ncbi:hypothetical protein H0H92_002969 [Tricholoma furcatifolium]|nr:hypothetical protein H0H92_002969 [Tricholoma furcatifolium]
MPEQPERKGFQAHIQAIINNEIKAKGTQPQGYFLGSSLRALPENLIAQCHAHALTINFGLEAHSVIISHSDFDDIISKDCCGPNSDARKAERMRSFPLPPRFVDTDSSTAQDVHKINIFAAFVTDMHAILLLDFVRLIRLHVLSSAHVWQPSDLEIGSKFWNVFWELFPDGPDWILEPDLALAALDAWCKRILSEKSSSGPIIEAIVSNKTQAFGGFGRHRANDFLFWAGIFPIMPSALICQSNSLYNHMKAQISLYLNTFETRDFHRFCINRPNTTNPFSFSPLADLNYMRHHIYVFRRVAVRMSADLYNIYMEQGLLDPNHTISEVYNKPLQQYKGKYQDLPVYTYSSAKDSVTV